MDLYEIAEPFISFWIRKPDIKNIKCCIDASLQMMFFHLVLNIYCVVGIFYVKNWRSLNGEGAV